MFKKNPTIYDIILFYNENNLLKKRIKNLENISKLEHIVVEIDHSYSGLKRQSALSEELKSKVIHKFVRINKKITNLSNPWDIEAFHRRCIMKLLKSKKINEGSIIVFSDADEIPSKKSLKRLRELFADLRNKNMIYVFEQEWYWLSPKYKFINKWLGSIAFRYSKETNIDLEAERRLRASRNHIKSGGKHLSYFLKENEIIHKLNSFAHCNDSRNLFFKNNFVDYVKLLGLNCMTSPFSMNRKLIFKEKPLNRYFLKITLLKGKLLIYDLVWVLIRIFKKFIIVFFSNFINLNSQLLNLFSLLKQNIFLKIKVIFKFNYLQKKMFVCKLDNIINLFKPFTLSSDLEWIGEERGYYIPNIKNFNYKPKFVISPGVGGSTEFEDYLYKNYQVNSITIDPNEYATPPKYGNFKHFYGFLSHFSDKNNGLFSLNDLHGKIRPKDCILQIDIEGDEWNIFKNINFDEECYPILIVEFHEILDNIFKKNDDTSYEKMIEVLNRINKFYIPIYTHSNNLSKSICFKGKQLSNIIEVSYISKKIIFEEEISYKEIEYKKLFKKYPSPRTFKLYPEAYISND